jgi:2'-5' RNA ligase
MTKERLKSPRTRLFAALDLLEETWAGIVAWGRRELDDPALRIVPPESLHVTLAFLGYLPEKEVGRLSEVVSNLKSPAPEIRLEDPVAKPSGRHLRLFVLPVDSPGTVELQAELQRELVAEGLYAPEKRPFWPHVTVARVKAGGKRSKKPREVAIRPGGLPQDLLQPARCVRVRLYRSELKPSGAEYRPLAQVELR